MTPKQEQKLDDIHDNVLLLRGRFDLIEREQEHLHEKIAGQQKVIDSSAGTIKDLVAIKNKGIGISLAGGTILGAFFSWLFKHL
jgi:hypothetical protein